MLGQWFPQHRFALAQIAGSHKRAAQHLWMMRFSWAKGLEPSHGGKTYSNQIPQERAIADGGFEQCRGAHCGG
ncbi:hypothetical protein NXC12_CH03013 [Rhizobium etli]|uniref:Uncharacterized protein n=1 Tax=Rhizobium etli TaxID=29449 RepID=A0AAN1EKS0_RHIET|nr:hypothetical protein NXC12_CH03013 [Rhizobium etli]